MKGRVLRLFAVLAVALIIFFLLNGYFNQLYVEEQRQAGTGSSLVTEGGWIDVEKLSNQTKEGRVVDSEIFFLLLGVDQNDGQSGENTRTDTMMLVKVDFDAGTIDLISLPRDSRVLVEGTYTKLNHAHSMGGVELTIQTIRDWLKIDLDYFVEVDFAAVVRMVDAIGGVDYEVPDIGMDYQYERQDGKIAYLKSGKQHMDGEEALGYLRYRKGYLQGDIGRVNAQQDFLKAVVKQMFDESGIGQIPAYIQTFFSDVRTNIPWDQLVGLAGKAGNLTGAVLETHTIPGEGEYIDDVSYYVVDKRETEQMIQETLPNYILLEFDDKDL